MLISSDEKCIFVYWFMLYWSFCGVISLLYPIVKHTWDVIYARSSNIIFMFQNFKKTWKQQILWSICRLPNFVFDFFHFFCDSSMISWLLIMKWFPIQCFLLERKLINMDPNHAVFSNCVTTQIVLKTNKLRL